MGFTLLSPLSYCCSMICRGVKGLIVVMYASGQVQICYLGTDPVATSRTLGQTKELDYEEMEAEHKQLLKQIRHAQSSKSVHYVKRSYRCVFPKNGSAIAYAVSLKEPNDRIRLWGEVKEYIDDAKVLLLWILQHLRLYLFVFS